MSPDRATRNHFAGKYALQKPPNIPLYSSNIHIKRGLLDRCCDRVIVSQLIDSAEKRKDIGPEKVIEFLLDHLDNNARRRDLLNHGLNSSDMLRSVSPRCIATDTVAIKAYCILSVVYFVINEWHLKRILCPFLLRNVSRFDGNHLPPVLFSIFFSHTETISENDQYYERQYVRNHSSKFSRLDTETRYNQQSDLVSRVSGGTDSFRVLSRGKVSTRVRRVTLLQAVTENGVSSEVSANIIFLFFSTFANKMTVVDFLLLGYKRNFKR